MSFLKSEDHEILRQSSEILEINDLERLPGGVCVLSFDEQNSGSEALGYFILDSIKKKPIIPSHLLEETHRREKSPQYLVGQLCANYKYGGVYKILVDEIDQAFPNLCWFRGGDYIETQSGAPGLTEFSSFGANGFLGDSRAIGYAKKNYNSQTHQNPVLYMIPLKALISGVNSGIIELGTEHDYDVVVVKKGDGFDQWSKDNIIVVDLGNSPDDFEKASSILKGKATVV